MFTAFLLTLVLCLQPSVPAGRLDRSLVWTRAKSGLLVPSRKVLNPPHRAFEIHVPRLIRNERGQAVLSWFNEASGAVAPDWKMDWSSVASPPSQTLADTQDNGKCNDVSGTSTTTLTVVTRSSTGLSFPSLMNNVLKVDGSTAGGGTSRKVIVNAVDVASLWSAPSIGNYQYMRYYFCSTLADNLQTGEPHYTECRPSNLLWFWKQRVPSGGTYVYTVGRDWPSNQDYYDFTTAFTTNTVYRVELQWYYKSSSAYNIAVRVYAGDSGTIFQDSTTTSRSFPNDGHTLANDVSGGNADWAFDTDGVKRAFQSMDVGQPGQASQANTVGNFVYFGGFAVWANKTDPNFWGSSPGTNLIYTSNG